MSISSIFSNLAAYPSNPSTNVQAAKKDLAALSSDLQSGNVAAAQQDFAALLQAAPQVKSQLQSGAGTPASSAFGALSTALQSGDLTGAQTAMATLQQTMRGHHHHHHHGGSSQSPTPAAPATGTAGNTVDSALTSVVSSATV